MVIGIGGASRSGKSTLAALLVNQFRDRDFTVIVLHQDDFVKKVSEIPLVNGEIDWETPLGIDFELSKDFLTYTAAHFDIVIFDGFLAFNEPTVNELFDKRLFVEISEDCFHQRKEEDTRWGIVPMWFREHIWSSYLQYGKSFDGERLTISGEKDFDLTFITNYLMN